MRTLTILATLLLAFGAQAQDPRHIWPAATVYFTDDEDLQQKFDAGDLGGGGDIFELCRDGTTPGVGLDPADGLYSVTCGFYNWGIATGGAGTNASYLVNCTGDGVGQYADDSSAARPKDASTCLRNGEQRLIGALHRVGMAVDRTKPGGQVILTEFPGKSHGLYVDDGCGTNRDGTRANCPEPYLGELRSLDPNFADYGPFYTRFKIQIERGVELVFERRGTFRESIEGDPTVTANTPWLDAVWIIGDRGNHAAETPGPQYGTHCAGGDCRTYDGPGEDILLHGYPIVMGGVDAIDEPYCRTTSDTDATCIPDTNLQGGSFQGSPLGEYAVQPGLLSTSEEGNWVSFSTAAPSGLVNEGYTGVCRDNRRIRCGVDGSDTRENHGCTFPDVDYGPCQNWYDAFQYDVETLGKPYWLAFHVSLCVDNPTTADDCGLEGTGDSIYVVQPRAFLGSGLIQLGNKDTVGAHVGGESAIAWPFPWGNFIPGGAFAVNRVYVVDPSKWFAGGTMRNGAVMPGNWLNRVSATAATASCESGGTPLTNTDDEEACDVSPLLGFGKGARTGVLNTTFYNGSQTHYKSSNIDFRGTGTERRFDGNLLAHRRRGAWADICNTTWLGTTAIDDRVLQSAANAFIYWCGNVTVENSVYRNLGGASPIHQLAQNSRNIVYRNNDSSGTNGQYWFIGTANGLTIEGNSINHSGTAIRVEAGNLPSNAVVRDVTIRKNQINGDFDYWGAGAIAGIYVLSDRDNTTRPDEILNLVVDGNSFTSRVSGACGVWIEEDSSSTGDASSLIDESRPQMKITDNDIIAPGNAQVVCIGDSLTNTSNAGGYATPNGDNADDSVAVLAERFQPVMVNNSASSVFQPGSPYSSIDGPDSPDCDVEGLGLVVATHTASAAGACDDTTPADGILDDAGTARATCACRSTGWEPL